MPAFETENLSHIVPYKSVFLTPGVSKLQLAEEAESPRPSAARGSFVTDREKCSHHLPPKNLYSVLQRKAQSRPFVVIREHSDRNFKAEVNFTVVAESLQQLP